MTNSWIEGWRQVFTRMSDDDIEDIDDSSIRDRHVGDGDGFTRSSDDSPENSIPQGKRTERWFSAVEREIEENERRTLENQKMLTRLDLRTVWIMRLLVGVLISVLSGVTLNILF